MNLSLVKGTDYTVEYTNNVNAGTATATLTGMGNFTGTEALNFTIDPKTFDITVNVNDAAMGSATGTGRYAENTLATLTATANQHYHFTGWSNGRTENPYTVYVERDSTITAQFALDSFKLNVVADEPDWGGVYGTGEYEYGAVRTISAQAANHFHFVNWSNGVFDATTTVTLTCDSTIVANFAMDRNTVTLTVNNPALGAVEGAGQYDYYDNTITLIAVPVNNHVRFDGWYSSNIFVTGLDTLYHIQIANDINLEARFSLDEHVVTAVANDAAMGSVTGGNTYTHGATATLVATPAAHYHFVNWSNGSVNDTLRFAVDTTYSLTANFAIDQHRLNAVSNNPAMGTVTGAGTYDWNTNNTITATPAANYHFVNWSNGSTDATTTVNLTSDTTIVANFAIDRNSVSATANDPALGRVTGDLGDWDYGTEVTLTAVPANNHVRFTSWSDGTTTNPYSFTVTSDVTLTANFALDRHLLSVWTGIGGTVSSGGMYNHGDTAYVWALPADHYHFAGWSDGNMNQAFYVVMDSNYSFTATFAIDQHVVRTDVNDNAAGTVSGAGTYNYGDTATLTAVPNAHYEFVQWSNGLTDDIINVTVAGDTTLTAIFARDEHTITVNNNNPAMGTVTGGSVYTHGDMATITATANAHHHFTGWSNGVTANPFSILVEKDSSVAANFAIDQHRLNAVANDAAMGSLTGAGTYDWNTNNVITATPAANYHFVNWSNGSIDATTTVNLTSDTTIVANFAIDRHNVAATANDPALGRVTGDLGDWDYGTEVTLTAVPANNHVRFTSWSDGTTTNPYSFTVTSDMALTANFALDRHILSVWTGLGGTVSSGGMYNHGDTAYVWALPADHYHFAGWSDGNMNQAFYVVMDSNYSFTATFAIDQHVVGTDVNDNAAGTVSGAGTYNYGDTATLTAIPNAHYEFVQWSNGLTDDIINVTVAGDTTLTAIFARDEHTITVNNNNPAMGTVTGGSVYTHGDMATITATANAHHHFTGWSNGVTANPFSILVERDSTVAANFAIDQHRLNAVSNNPAMGSVTGAGTYDWNTNNTITATPAANYHFVNWSNGSTDATTTVNLQGDTTIVANFAIDRHNVAAAANDPALGRVTGDLGDWDYGTEVTLTAVPANNHVRFTSWSDGTTTNPYSFTVTSDMALTANFALDRHILSVWTGLGGTVSSGGMYNHGDTAYVWALPADHYHFAGWSDGNMNQAFYVVMDSNYSFTATFAIDQHVVRTDVNDNAAGTVSGAGTYNYGATATLTATPADHYVFVSWSNGATTATINVTVAGDTTLTANFALGSHTVTASVNDATMGTVTGAGSYLHGTMATLTATPAAHYHFVNWSNGSTSSVLNFLVENDTAVTATFAADQYAVTTQVNNMTLGTVTGAGSYTYGDTVTITASPADHAVFQNWSNGSTVNPYTFVLTSDMTFTANFGMDSHEIVANVNDTLMGSVTGAGTYTHGTMATLTAVANEHYHFDRWSNGATTSTISIFVEDDSTVTAYFSVDMHRVVVNLNDDDMGYVSGTGVYYYGDTVTLTANANPHYDFAGWSNGDTNPVLTFVVDGDITLQANFVAEVYTVTAQSDNDTMGSVSGSGSYSYGDMVVLIATANAGYHFVSWSDGDTNAVRTFEAEMDVTLTAHFEATVGIREAEAASFIVAGESMRVVVKAAEGEQVWVYDVNGRMLHHTQRAAELETYAVPASGLYLVKVGNYPARRVVVLR